MILLVDLCSRPGSLSRDEFVGPVARIVERAGAAWREVHCSEADRADLTGIRGIILCGTALQDNVFSEQVARVAPCLKPAFRCSGSAPGCRPSALPSGGASARPARSA